MEENMRQKEMFDVFDKFVKDTQEHDFRLLQQKRRAYSPESNRFLQFELISEWTGLTPEQVALVLGAKHFSALFLSQFHGTKIDSKEVYRDARNYLYIAEALANGWEAQSK